MKAHIIRNSEGKYYNCVRVGTDRDAWSIEASKAEVYRDAEYLKGSVTELLEWGIDFTVQSVTLVPTFDTLTTEDVQFSCLVIKKQLKPEWWDGAAWGPIAKAKILTNSTAPEEMKGLLHIVWGYTPLVIERATLEAT